MAHRKGIRGLASIVVVEDDAEIDAMLNDPNLDRTYDVKGPLLNRLMVLRLRHALFRDGRALLSFAPRDNNVRTAAQGALAKRLDTLALSKPWDGQAIAAMAAYVVTGADRDTAHAALTYTTAYPFLRIGKTSFEPATFLGIFEMFEVLQVARRPWRGLYARLVGKDKQATREILEATGDDDYGLHAVGNTLANSVVILGHMRAQFATSSSTDAKAAFEWNGIRTAPVAVIRQNRAPCRLPGIEAELPAHSLLIMKMRQAQRSDSPAGFEFASKHWSFCPASQYMETIFADVHGAAINRSAA